MTQPRLTYFAADGNYGSAEDILVVDTGRWSDEELEAVALATDLSRIKVARQIADNYGDNPAQLRIDLDAVN
jgi:hypothetical protein